MSITSDPRTPPGTPGGFEDGPSRDEMREAGFELLRERIAGVVGCDPRDLKPRTQPQQP